MGAVCTVRAGKGARGTVETLGALTSPSRRVTSTSVLTLAFLYQGRGPRGHEGSREGQEVSKGRVEVREEELQPQVMP